MEKSARYYLAPGVIALFPGPVMTLDGEQTHYGTSATCSLPREENGGKVIHLSSRLTSGNSVNSRG